MTAAIAASAASGIILGCAREAPISFSQEVKPILDRYCLECHQPGGAGHEASGLDLGSYEDLMQGTRNGPMVIPGDSLGSNLLVLMEGRADPSIRMPHGKNIMVTGAEIETVRAWIDQGAENN